MTQDSGLLDQIIARYDSAPEDQKKQLKDDALKATAGMLWVPNPGPQTDAYFCEADETYYGGEAGGGKTDLLIGLALTAHKKSLLIRRINDDARGLADRMAEIVGHTNGLNRTLLEWRLGQRLIEFGGCQLEDDKQRYKGKPHDLIGFDEGADLTQTQFEFIIMWNRSVDPDQRCRVVVASNPPTTAEGVWITERWGAWLDKRHPRYPQPPGKILWYMKNDEDREVEVDGPGPHLIRGRMIRATSRTFIKARLEDNPSLARTDYGDRLELASEDLRKVYRGGDYEIGLRDQPNQLIPTAWIDAAQKRWTPNRPEGFAMTSIGVDCSGGGKDPMILAPRYDTWFAPLIEIQGKDIPMDAMGKFGCSMIVSNRKDRALIVLDMGGGYGQSIFENLKDNAIEVQSYKGQEATGARTKDRQHGFYNIRSYAWWQMREALDPDQEQGSPIALPPDSRLRADLSTPTFTIESRGIKLETKEDIVKRLGRSTDRGDSVVMAWHGGFSSALGHKMPRRNKPIEVVTKRATRTSGSGVVVTKRMRRR